MIDYIINSITHITLVDVWGHIGYGLLFLGQFLISKNNSKGWALRTVGEVLWLIIGFYIGMSSVWIWGTLFLYVDIKGWYDWNKKEKQEKDNN